MENNKRKTKTSAAVKNRYIAKAYDRINLTVPKGKKDLIHSYAGGLGMSVNRFINYAIDEQIIRDFGDPNEPDIIEE